MQPLTVQRRLDQSRRLPKTFPEPPCMVYLHYLPTVSGDFVLEVHHMILYGHLVHLQNDPVL